MDMEQQMMDKWWTCNNKWNIDNR